MTSGVVRKIGNTALRRRLQDQVWEDCDYMAGQYMASGIDLDFDVDMLLKLMTSDIQGLSMTLPGPLRVVKSREKQCSL